MTTKEIDEIIANGKALYDECNHGCDGPATEYVILCRILADLSKGAASVDVAAEAILHIKDFED